MAEKPPLTIGDLARQMLGLDENALWNKRPIRIRIGGSETVALVDAELSSDDPIHGPQLLLTPDMLEFGTKTGQMFTENLMAGFDRRKNMRDEVWEFLGGFFTRREQYHELIKRALGETHWHSAKSDELLQRIHEGMQRPAEYEKLARMRDTMRGVVNNG